MKTCLHNNKFIVRKLINSQYFCVYLDFCSTISKKVQKIQDCGIISKMITNIWIFDLYTILEFVEMELEI